MTQGDPVEVVQAWVAAANAGDAERLVALSAPDIEVVGPRGIGAGHRLLREWLARAGLSSKREGRTRGEAGWELVSVTPLTIDRDMWRFGWHYNTREYIAVYKRRKP
jgi:hypothetical protein